MSELETPEATIPKFFIQTSTGVLFDLLWPKPELVILEDLAWALSCISRWGGHARPRFPVAPHQLATSDIAKMLAKMAGWSEADQQLAGDYSLVHDGHEAYTGDMTRPVQRTLAAMNPSLPTGTPGWPVFCEKIQRAVHKRFNLEAVPGRAGFEEDTAGKHDYELAGILDDADNILLVVEHQIFFKHDKGRLHGSDHAHAVTTKYRDGFKVFIRAAELVSTLTAGDRFKVFDYEALYLEALKELAARRGAKL